MRMTQGFAVFGAMITFLYMCVSSSSWYPNCRIVQITGWGCYDSGTDWQPDLKFGLQGYCAGSTVTSKQRFVRWRDMHDDDDGESLGGTCDRVGERTVMACMVALVSSGVGVMIAFVRFYNEVRYVRVVTILMPIVTLVSASVAACMFKVGCLDQIREDSDMTNGDDVGIYTGLVGVMVTPLLAFILFCLQYWVKTDKYGYEDARVEPGRRVAPVILADRNRATDPDRNRNHNKNYNSHNNNYNNYGNNNNNNNHMHRRSSRDCDDSYSNNNDNNKNDYDGNHINNNNNNNNNGYSNNNDNNNNSYSSDRSVGLND